MQNHPVLAFNWVIEEFSKASEQFFELWKAVDQWRNCLNRLMNDLTSGNRLKNGINRLRNLLNRLRVFFTSGNQSTACIYRLRNFLNRLMVFLTSGNRLRNGINRLRNGLNRLRNFLTRLRIFLTSGNRLRPNLSRLPLAMLLCNLGVRLPSTKRVWVVPITFHYINIRQGTIKFN